MIVQKFYFSLSPVTLFQGHSHSNWYQNVQFKSVIKPSLKQIGLQAFKCKPILKHILNKIPKAEFAPLNINPVQKIIISLHRLRGPGNTLNLIEIDGEICEKLSTEVSAFSYNCDLK